MKPVSGKQANKEESRRKEVRRKQDAHPTTYVCGDCGATRRRLIWGALGLETAIDQCAGCGGWVTFAAYTEAAEKAA